MIPKYVQFQIHETIEHILKSEQKNTDPHFLEQWKRLHSLLKENNLLTLKHFFLTGSSAKEIRKIEIKDQHLMESLLPRLDQVLNYPELYLEKEPPNKTIQVEKESPLKNLINDSNQGFIKKIGGDYSLNDPKISVEKKPSTEKSLNDSEHINSLDLTEEQNFLLKLKEKDFLFSEKIQIEKEPSDDNDLSTVFLDLTEEQKFLLKLKQTKDYPLPIDEQFLLASAPKVIFNHNVQNHDFGHLEVDHINRYPIFVKDPSGQYIAFPTKNIIMDSKYLFKFNRVFDEKIKNGDKINAFENGKYTQTAQYVIGYAYPEYGIMTTCLMEKLNDLLIPAQNFQKEIL